MPLTPYVSLHFTRNHTYIGSPILRSRAKTCVVHGDVYIENFALYIAKIHPIRGFVSRDVTRHRKSTTHLDLCMLLRAAVVRVLYDVNACRDTGLMF